VAGRDGKEQPADYVKRIRWIFDDKRHWKLEDLDLLAAAAWRTMSYLGRRQ
jgi:hypothetical protein